MNGKCSTKITVDFSLAITQSFKVPQYFVVTLQQAYCPPATQRAYHCLSLSHTYSSASWNTCLPKLHGWLDHFVPGCEILNNVHPVTIHSRYRTSKISSKRISLDPTSKTWRPSCYISPVFIVHSIWLAHWSVLSNVKLY
jgi:hypothetical protein